ncbi:MAG: CPBP family intramembrane metalloprotease, partial [Bacteroidetes bacterium]
RWPRSVVVASAVTWVLYLLAYEFMFRGWLFFTCLDAMGPELAIVVNVSLYALVHVPKGFNETVGAIPLGALLCWLTMQTGTIWIAFLVHSIMALSNEWFSMYYTRKVRA